MNEEQNELVQVQQGTTALAHPLPVSSWGDEDEEIKPRQIILKNPKSKNLDDFLDGYFIDKVIKRQWKTMRIVPLKIMLTRRFQSPFKLINNAPAERELYCRSNDRKHPVMNDDRFEPQAEDCTTCPFGNLAWAGWNRKTGAGKPTNSCEREALIVFIEETNPAQPYLYYVRGTNGTPEVEKLFNTLKEISKDAATRPVEEGGTGGRRPEMYEYVITMETELDNLANPFPVFTAVDELTQEEAQEKYGKAFYDFVVLRQQQMLAAQEAAQAAQGVADAGQSTVVEAPAQPVSRPTARPAPAVSRPAAGPAVKRPAATPATEAPATTTSRPAARTEIIPPAARKTTSAVRPTYHPPTEAEIVVEPGDEEEVTP